MKIIKQEKSKLLPRIDVIAIKEHIESRTPSYEEAKEELSKDLKADKDLILIEHIYPNFGIGSSKIIAYVYESKEAMEKVIKKTKKQREAEAKAAEEAAKKEAEAAQANNEEAQSGEGEAEKVEENGEEANKE